MSLNIKRRLSNLFNILRNRLRFEFRNLFTKRNLIILISILLIFVLYLYFFTPQDCGTDKECFNKLASRCSLVNVVSQSQAFTFLYEIRGSSGDDCVVNIKMLKVSREAATPEIAEKLENKAMVCKFNKAELKAESLDKFEKTLNFCTGPLKEGMLDLIIERLYAIVVSNLGKIVTNLEDVLKVTNITTAKTI